MGDLDRSADIRYPQIHICKRRQSVFSVIHNDQACPFVDGTLHEERGDRLLFHGIRTHHHNDIAGDNIRQRAPWLIEKFRRHAVEQTDVLCS